MANEFGRWMTRLRKSLGWDKSLSGATGVNKRFARPAVEVLEDRWVPSALTDITTTTVFTAVEGNSTGSQVLATFTDTNAGAATTDFTGDVTINWGDSSTSAGTVNLVSSGATSTFDVVGSHFYATPATYPVSVSISDIQSDSLTSSGFTSFKVAAGTLTDATTANVFTANGGTSTGSQVVATFTDTDPSAVASNFPSTGAIISWGDGTTSDGTVALSTSSGTTSTFTVTGSHTYSATGTFHVSVAITGTDGSTLASTSGTTFDVSTFGTITGTVFLDTNHNGALDSADTDIPGVAVTLVGTDPGTSGNTSIDVTAVTNAEGSYTFTNVPAGNYKVESAAVSGLIYGSAQNFATGSATIAAGTAGASESGSTVKITTTAADGLKVGQSVTIAGVGVAGYNGTFTILTTPTPTTFTYTDTTHGLAASGGGTASALSITSNAQTVTQNFDYPGGVAPAAFSLRSHLTSSTNSSLPFFAAAGSGTAVADHKPTVSKAPAAVSTTTTSAATVDDLASNFTDADFTDSEVTFNIIDGSTSVASVAVTNGGSGYTVAPTVTFSAPASGVTATGRAVISGGKVTGVTIINAGSGYTSTPTVTIAAPTTGTTATATATLKTIPINVTLLDTQAPQSVANIFDYIDSGAYNDAIFTRLTSPTDALNSGIGVLQAGGLANQGPGTAAIAAASTGATESGTTVTITTTAADNFQVGQTVSVTGVGVAGYDGVFTITGVPTSTSFTYTDTTSSLAASGGGSATVNLINITANPTGAAPGNEFLAANSNVAGTLAMAQSGGSSTPGPTSSTQFFFNTTNNASALDPQDFTVFGKVADAASLQALESLAKTPVQNLSGTVDIATGTKGASESGSTVTITTTEANHFAVGQTVTISGVGVSGYNGSFTIVATPTPTTFTYTATTTGLAASGAASLGAATAVVPAAFANASGANLLNSVPLVNNYTGNDTTFPSDATSANFVTISSVTVDKRTEFLNYSLIAGASGTAVGGTTPGVATASITNEYLTITPVAAGTTTFTIEATDRYGATVTTTVAVTVT